MNRFEFKSRLRIILAIGMAIGLISLIIQFFVTADDYKSQFWGDVLLNNTFFMGMSLMALFTLSAFITAWAGWYTVFRRLLEVFNVFLLPGAIIMLLLAIGNYLGWHHLYLWSDSHMVEHDSVIQGKSAFLNNNMYLIATIVFVGIWLGFRWKLKSLTKLEEAGVRGDFSYHRKMRNWSAVFLPIAGYTSAILIWLWIMSVEVHWYSTLYAWYTAASWFVAMISLFIIVLIYLKKNGYFELVTMEHIHDLGKFLFAFSIFWTYLFFDQYMLIWFGNVGEETAHFKLQQTEYPFLFFTILVMNFVIPFLGLMINTAKKTYWVLLTVAVITFLGHWFDMYLNLKPYVAEGVHHLTGQAHEVFPFPNVLEFATMIGFLSLFVYLVLNALSKVELVPENDPYLEESLHHHV
ncbi:MAG: hypothetical protein R2771_08210 [Saprospiraceae bacterium]